MSGKIITAVAAAILVASTGLASAKTHTVRHENETQRYYNVVPYAAPSATEAPDHLYPFPVTGQSGV